MQIVSRWDILHEMSNPVLKKKYEICYLLN